MDGLRYGLRSIGAAATRYVTAGHGFGIRLLLRFSPPATGDTSPFRTAGRTQTPRKGVRRTLRSVTFRFTREEA